MSARTYHYILRVARTYHYILRVARTIADLADSETVKAKRITEALSYRRLERQA